VRADIQDESVRHELIAMLPRLKRFADVLIGEKKEGRALLRRALLRMLNDRHRYQRGIPFDRWAFAEIYQLWLGELRHHADPLRQAKASEADFVRLFPQEQGIEFDALTVNFLGHLPPQQRSTLLLVYGEGFNCEDAGRVLDSNADTIRSRLIRASASLADRLSSKSPARAEGRHRHRDPLPQETAG
jgi:DNA-directed RNA polymerase specialized sigma24 family protein